MSSTSEKLKSIKEIHSHELSKQTILEGKDMIMQRRNKRLF